MFFLRNVAVYLMNSLHQSKTYIVEDNITFYCVSNISLLYVSSRVNTISRCPFIWRETLANLSYLLIFIVFVKLTITCILRKITDSYLYRKSNTSPAVSLL